MIRTMTASLLVTLTLLAALPHPLIADDRTVASARPGRIDFDKYQPTPAAFADTTAAPPASNGKAGWSTAKKTWLIVGIVVGVGAVAYAISNNHSSSGGSGGGGY
jgi:hypothetical protein